MTFDEILEQVIALLKRQERVSYGAIKRRFDLDDGYLEDLKGEILYVHETVVEADERGFKWTGQTEVTPITPSQSDHSEPPPVVEQPPPSQVQTASIESPVTDVAERRQLSVMFCDLVGSTALSGELDPEDLRDVVREYQKVCTEVIQRYDGHVAQLLGDGLLVYFGYPQAHEDDAQRAVRSGLEIVNALGTLNTRLEQDKSIRLAVRLGVHTGLVVIGEMGGEGRQEQLALGETPNVAARIQGLAEPDTLIVSDATYRLVQGFFDAEPLGEHDLKGVAQPLAIHRILQVSEAQSSLDVASTRGLTPLVGRESESTLLFERWAQAKDGQGQIVLLSGEAGIGKSRLVQALKDHVAVGVPYTRLERRSSPYFTNSALYPVIDMLQRVLRWQPDDTTEAKLEKLEHNLRQYRLPVKDTVSLFGALLSLPVPEDRYPPLNLSPQRQRQKTLESIVAIILELSERQPVVFILEDLHWTDPTTLEFIELLIDQTPTVSLCVLLTCRPEYQPTWSHRSYLTEITLSHLARTPIERMVEQVTGGKRLPAEVLDQIIDKTDGVPLYVEEMTKAVLESGVLKDIDGQYELTGPISTLSIPATLQDSLMARLDRLVTAKAVAQYASVIGRQFSYELLQAVSQLDNTVLERELGLLVDAELIYQRGLPPQTTYLFKHALVVTTAYESLLRSTRQGYHDRIAEALVDRFPESHETAPELLAYHYTEAGLHEQAVGYWQQAGEKAIQRSANAEAIAHLTKGLDLLESLPDTPTRNQEELRFLITLGPALVFTKGHTSPEVKQVYTRAQSLCQQTGETSQLIDVLYGMRRFSSNHGEYDEAREFAEQSLNLAHDTQDPVSLAISHYSLAFTLYCLGELTDAHAHLERGTVLSENPENCPPALLIERVGTDIGLVCRITLANAFWLRGYPEQALQHVDAVLNLSQERSHTFAHVHSLGWAGFVYRFCRDISLAEERAQELVILCREQQYEVFGIIGTIQHGWVLAEQGQREQSLEQIRQGLMALRAIGQRANLSPYLALLAEVYGTVGQTEEGLVALDEAHVHVKQTGERYYEAELHRLKGELLLQQSSDNATEAETCFQQAISIAQNQSAKSWELRAATSLAKLWQNQGKRDEAHELLKPVYSWFTEGFDTADLIDAKALLDELS